MAYVINKINRSNYDKRANSISTNSLLGCTLWLLATLAIRMRGLHTSPVARLKTDTFPRKKPKGYAMMVLKVVKLTPVEITSVLRLFLKIRKVFSSAPMLCSVKRWSPGPPLWCNSFWRQTQRNNTRYHEIHSKNEIRSGLFESNL